MAITWPLAAELGDRIPAGTEHVATVPHAMAFSFAWVADRLSHGLHGLWDAPIFWPTERSFALSEPNLLGGLLTAPLTWIGGPAVGLGVFLLVSLAANGWAASRLLRAAGLGRLASRAGGVAVLLLPAVHQELGVVPLVPVWGVLGTVGAAAWCGRAPGARRGLVVGAALGGTYLLCAQYALFTAVLLGTAGLLLVERWSGRLAVAVLAAGVAFGVLAGPVVVQQRAVMAAEPGFVRTEAEVRSLAATPGSFARTAWPQAVPVPGIRVDQPARKAFHPGTGRLGLALLGVLWGLGVPRMRRPIRFVAAAALVSYAMALGPHLSVGGGSVWEAASTLIPGYGHVRAVSRWAVFVQLAVVVLAACGVQGLVDRVRGRAPSGDDGGRAGRRSGQRVAVLAVGVLLCAAEIVPARSSLVPVPPAEVGADWARYVREQTPRDAVLVFLPMPPDGTVAAFAPEAAHMLQFRAHRRRTIGGYASWFPRPFRAAREASQDLAERESWEALAAHGVTHAVIDLRRVDELPPSVELVMRDQVAGRAVLALPAGPATPAAPTPPPGSRPPR